MVMLLMLVTLALASPTASLETKDSRHLIRQVATAASLTLPSIPTITIDILQPPYVSLHSITARDAQTPEPTTTTPPQLGSVGPVWTVTVRSHHELKSIIYGLQTTNISSALHHWTQVPVASSACSFTRAVDINQTEWDCTAICGALNEDGQCSRVTHCLEMGDGNPRWANSAESARSNGYTAERAVAAMGLVFGVWMLL